MSIGENIKRLLVEQDRKQSELANYLRVKPNTVNRWIPTDNKNKHIIEPSYETIEKIAKFFDVSIEAIKNNNQNNNDKSSLSYISRLHKRRRDVETLKAYLYDIGYVISIKPSKNKTDGFNDIQKNINKHIMKRDALLDKLKTMSDETSPAFKKLFKQYDEESSLITRLDLEKKDYNARCIIKWRGDDNIVETRDIPADKLDTVLQNIIKRMKEQIEDLY